jgi:hypothetical protein
MGYMKSFGSRVVVLFTMFTLVFPLFEFV